MIVERPMKKTYNLEVPNTVNGKFFGLKSCHYMQVIV